jgi:very-short-patch-repair endonuclease
MPHSLIPSRNRADGSQHNDTSAIRYDLARTAFLENSGWTVLRFTNDDVLKDIEGVCNHIIITATQRSLQ